MVPVPMMPMMRYAYEAYDEQGYAYEAFYAETLSVDQAVRSKNGRSHFRFIPYDLQAETGYFFGRLSQKLDTNICSEIIMNRQLCSYIENF